MMRYFGLDVGAKKIGVAVGETIASELTTISAPKDKTFYQEEGIALAAVLLKEMMAIEQAEAIVVGLPVDEDGSPTEESRKIETFGRKLGEALNVEVAFVDETLTTFMAEEMLESQGVKGDEKENRSHQLAAELILEQYFEEHVA